ncbi:MAG TPA: branched-chain amino acid ABC transporter permease [Candidatus Dormibacteraeota bacterium]|jgi:branched-subunit amino acid ABC-type transport system permease component|nr:branched-chain amino acid ABC transporter permease [Candidatus Dormibacteraeota bacterium]
MLRLIVTLIYGITAAGPLFLIASGLTLIYGVMRVLNFAHAALFMLGAYVSVQLSGGPTVSLGRFVLAAAGAGLAVGLVGLVVERLVFRPLYSRNPEATLLASFGLSLLIAGAVERFWGTEPLTQPLPSALSSSVSISTASISVYALVELGVAVVVAAALMYMLRRTRFGANAVAVAEDREMAAVMGIRARRVGAIVFVLGSALAGLAGAIVAPTVSVDTGLAPSTLIPVFAVVVMGGLGTVGGAALASLAIALVQGITTNYLPAISPYAFILLLALFLIVRPQGLLGRLQLSREA